METDGWDEDGGRKPSVRRIHRLFFFFGFIALIAAVVVVFKYIPARIVVNYPSGGRRVCYINRYDYYFKSDPSQMQYLWTDTLYNADGSVISRVNVDKAILLFMLWNQSFETYKSACFFYYNEATIVTPETIHVIVDAICDKSYSDHIYRVPFVFENTAKRMSDVDSIESDRKSVV